MQDKQAQGSKASGAEDLLTRSGFSESHLTKPTLADAMPSCLSTAEAPCTPDCGPGHISLGKSFSMSLDSSSSLSVRQGPARGLGLLASRRVWRSEGPRATGFTALVFECSSAKYSCFSGAKDIPLQTCEHRYRRVRYNISSFLYKSCRKLHQQEAHTKQWTASMTHLGTPRGMKPKRLASAAAAALRQPWGR